MAINPFMALPIAAPVATSVGTPPPLAQPVLAVAPAAESAQPGHADCATSEQSRQQDRQPPADAIETINASLRAWATNLRFEIDPDAQRLVVSVIDSESGDVLRTVPNEAVMRIARMVASLQGKAVDTSA